MDERTDLERIEELIVYLETQIERYQTMYILVTALRKQILENSDG